MEPQHVIDYIHSHYRREGAAPIAKKFGIAPGSVRYIASLKNLTVDTDVKRANEIAWLTNRKPSDYKVNPDVFRNVTTPEAAYLLGFLWADGHIYKGVRSKRRISMSILTSDINDIRPTIEKIGQWNWRTFQMPKRRLQTRIETSNKPLFDFLEENDYRSKEASPDKILSTIPDHLKHYWFRGLFDGDGHINANGFSKRVVIASCYEQDWKYMEDLCKRIGIESCLISRTILENSRSSIFSFFKVIHIIKFCEYIYQGYDEDKIGLTRKHVKYKELVARNIKPSSRETYSLKEIIYDRSDKTNYTKKIVRLLPPVPKPIKIDPLAHLTKGEKISLKTSRSVTCVTNGKIYKSALQAAEDTGVRRMAIYDVINGKRANANGFVFVLTPKESAN